jgi:hypothetical protein
LEGRRKRHESFREVWEAEESGKQELGERGKKGDRGKGKGRGREWWDTQQ